ncbi:UPF0481-like protein isoform X1 [Cinnamomum micranthum f. kanehirae]|uniref:UPF0481-like protein isoform X1 n=1 Tax=Cinnamomum micranthum f. kanehirae TaxID=337451 RepID=A0A443P802_9MAGN|nr:UPF0481-like protein isoform X1 [Cinnamomum micranthum f. kanehirae]
MMEQLPEEIEDIERGFPNEPEDLATRVTQLIKLNEGEEGVELWKKHSIYKVHAAMAAVNPGAFTPKVVSMGPYHHGKEHLMPMEVHKQRAARRFILDSGNSIKDFIDGLWEVLPELMDSYSQLDPVWREDKNKGRFLELMLIDGCFLIEILHIRGEISGNYDEHDPILSFNGTLSYPLVEDLMMLENQVPFTALEKLLTIQNGGAPEQNSEFIKDFMPLFLYGRKHPDVRKGMHMLDVARHGLFKLELSDDGVSQLLAVGKEITEHGGFVGANEETLKYVGEMHPAKRSRSVMELCRAGVKFRKAEDETIPLTSIVFENNGVITIPVIPLHFLSEVQGCNMVAFELIHPGTFFPTLSYFTFMKGLLTSAADVRHLRSLKIIQSTESSDDAIVETFKMFAKDTELVTPGTRLYQVQDQLHKFYDARMTGCKGIIWEWYTSLKQKYFKNPWTSISVAAAIILLAFAAVQTYYTALPYWYSKHHKNN